MSLTDTEIERYARHLILDEVGEEGQARLLAARVLVVGAGGLGSPLLLYLAAAGVGTLGIVDDDTVALSNLQRQVIHATGEVGKAKVDSASVAIARLNPHVVVERHATRLTAANALDLIARYDLVADGSDNFATRYLVSDACYLAKKPLVTAAVGTFDATLTTLRPHETAKDGRPNPTYRCLFPEPPEPGTVPNCAEAGVLGVLPGLIGTVQATEAIKLLTGIGEPLSGRLLMWDALTMTTHTVRLAADPRSRAIRELPPAGYGETCAALAPVPDESDVAALRSALAAGRRVQLIDVREEWERTLGAILPSVHAPLGAIERGDFDLAGLDPTVETVVYCAVGARSLRALATLRARHGFRAATSLRGGYKAWAASA